MSDSPIQGTQEQVLAFIKSMVNMQAEFENVARTAEGKVGKTGDLRTFKYMDYPTLVEYLRPHMKKHGFCHFANPGSVVEMGAANEGGAVMLSSANGRVVLAHEGGGMAIADYAIPIGSARDAGGVHTYFRRYALAGLVGIASEEDTDAEGHENPRPGQQAAKQRQGTDNKQPPGREKAQAQLKQLLELIRTRATSKKEQEEMTKAVAEHAQDVHGSLPSALAAAGAVFKLDEVLRWADEKLGQSKRESDHDEAQVTDQWD